MNNIFAYNNLPCGFVVLLRKETLRFEQSFSLAKALQRGGTHPRHMMHFGNTSWSEYGFKMALCRFIYGAIKG